MTYGWDLMQNYRTYGDPPCPVVVVHGGPGAAGEMAPVARELSRSCGVLEPLQTEVTLNGQISELVDILQKYGSVPVTLVGHSWGAMLGFVVAAGNPGLVKKLILIGSGPLDEQYASSIMNTRMSRLAPEDREELEHLMRLLDNPGTPGKDGKFARFGEIIGRADSFDPVPDAAESIVCRHEPFERVWDEMHAMRKSGKLLSLGTQVVCPVVAIHGDYDPHPVDGVREPLGRVIKNFRCIVLEKCGHTPWTERHARDEFFSRLIAELGSY